MESQQAPVALVTGGAVRVGRAISTRLARDGYHVAINFHSSRPAADGLVRELRDAGLRASAFGADITAFGSARALADEVEGAIGPIELLVNNAAVFERRPFRDLDPTHWSRHLKLNLEAPLYLCHEIGDRMWERGRGRIVNICGNVGIQPPGEYVAYCISKSGLDMLTRCAAEALAPRVQVNGVAPGAILFPEGTTDSERQAVLDRVPTGREGSPEDVATVVAFFASAPDYVTGTILPVDGGAALVTG